MVYACGEACTLYCSTFYFLIYILIQMDGTYHRIYVQIIFDTSQYVTVNKIVASINYLDDPTRK